MFHWFSRQPRRTPARPKKPCMLELEHLENRLVPTLTPTGPVEVSDDGDPDTDPAVATSVDRDTGVTYSICAWVQRNNDNTVSTDIVFTLGSFDNGFPGGVNTVPFSDTDENETQPDVAVAPNG